MLAMQKLKILREVLQLLQQDEAIVYLPGNFPEHLTWH